MKEILKRLKSPVVLIQLLTVVGTLIVVFLPQFSKEIKEIVVTVTAVINIFAGLNNPVTKKSF
jgi:hypothetical protein